jgi:hypothetical protein
MKIAIVKQDTDDDFSQHCELPWRAFFETLIGEGHVITSIWNNPHVVVFMNHHEKLFNKLSKKDSKIIFVLVIWESPITRPLDFMSKTLKRYDLILTPSKDWVKNFDSVVFPWPQGQSIYTEQSIKEFNERDSRAVVFQSNKFSFIRGELYSLRRGIIKEFDQDLLVYGQGWNNYLSTLLELFKAIIQVTRVGNRFCFPNTICLKVPHYLGYVEEKRLVLEKFKFVVVIENSMEYVSEKLFEALWGGCCVLYVGPDLKEYGLPDLAIQCYPSKESIYQTYLDLLDNEDLITRTRTKAREFLLSKNFQRLNNENVLTSMAKVISNKVQELASL